MENHLRHVSKPKANTMANTQQVTVRYGVDSITRTFDVPVTIRQLRQDANIRAALGYGDSVKYLINGVEMRDDVIVPNGTTVSVETSCNTKAAR